MEIANRRRPGTFDWRRTPGPRLLSALEGGFAGQLCLAAPALSSAVGEGGLGQLPATYRLYNCQRCRMQVCICAQCDCGNLYCPPGECAQRSRRESVRRAGARYQRSFRGARKHADRQRRYRERRKSEVTHHTFSLVAKGCSVLRHPITASELIDVASKECRRTSSCSLQRCCTFCGRPLPEFARLYSWRWRE